MQYELHIQLQCLRPLLAADVLSGLADLSHERIVWLIETGELATAWDIRTVGAGRPEIRIWRESMLDLVAQRPQTRRPVADVIASIMPHGRETLRTPEVHRLLGCSQLHTYRLIEDGLLEVEGRRTQIRGTNSIYRVRRESLVRFLMARAL